MAFVQAAKPMRFELELHASFSKPSDQVLENAALVTAGGEICRHRNFAGRGDCRRTGLGERAYRARDFTP